MNSPDKPIQVHSKERTNLEEAIAALEAKRRIKAGLLRPYRQGGFTAEVRRSITGRLEVWAQYTGGES